MPFSRRAFLSSSLLLSGCATRRATVRLPLAADRMAPVRVAPERVIRVTTGLRPFRPSGFVVRAEKFDEKLVVHNYGHGGAGITLSWGTADLALQAAAGFGEVDCAVIGCGVVGLATARLLQQRGFKPTIYAKNVPPDTTSNFAGGLWEPVTVYDAARVTPLFRQQFGDAARFAYRRFRFSPGNCTECDGFRCISCRAMLRRWRVGAMRRRMTIPCGRSTLCIRKRGS